MKVKEMAKMMDDILKADKEYQNNLKVIEKNNQAE